MIDPKNGAKNMRQHFIPLMLVGSLLLSGCENSSFGQNSYNERSNATNPLLYVILGVGLAALVVSQSSSSGSGTSCYVDVSSNTTICR